jgi:DNA replication protein DnaC
MLNVPTMEKLKELRFHGMALALEEQLSSSSYDELSFQERLGMLVDREMTERENRRLTSRLKKAKFGQRASIEDVDYKHPRGLDRSLMRALLSCSWVKDHLNILITGPTGVGKSYIACALGHQACLQGFKALYFRTSRLFQNLAVARGDGQYHKLVNTIAKTHVFIVDDWGLSKLDDHKQIEFLDILEDRHNIHSTIITSQFPPDHWHELMDNPTLSDAILDRFIHNAYKINLKGESMRKKKSELTKQK